MASNWQTTRTQALKVLGNKAKFPEPKNLAALIAKLEQSFQTFDKSRNAIEDNITAMQNAGSSFAQAAKQFSGVVDKADFGLNAKDPEDANKIKTAKSLVSDYLDEVAEQSAHNDKALTELEKHLLLMSKYKQSV